MLASRLSALAFILLMLTASVAPAQITWDGGGDGSSWSDPANWSSGAVPTDVDDVLLDGGATVTLDIAAETADLTLDDATVGGSFDLTVHGFLDWGLGEHAGTGIWTALGGARLSENSTKTLRGPVAFACDVTWETSTLVFDIGGRLELRAGFDLNVVLGPNPPAKKLDHAAIPLGGTDPTAEDPEDFAIRILGYSYVEAPVTLDVSFRQAGTMDLESNLALRSGSEFTGTTRLGDSIRLNLGYGYHELEGDFQKLSQGNPEGLFLDGNQTFAFIGGGYSADPELGLDVTGPITVTKDIPRIGLNDGYLELFDGTVIDLLQASGPGSTIIANNAARIADSLFLDTTSPTTIAGDLTIEQSATVSGSGILLEDGSTLHVASGGTLDWQSPISNEAISPSSGSATVHVEGQFQVDGGNAPMRVLTDLRLDPGANLIVGSGASLQLDEDSSIEGDVSLFGDLLLRQGTHQVAAPATITGPGGLELQAPVVLNLSGINSLGANLNVAGTISTDATTTLTGDVTANGGSFEGLGVYTFAGPVDFLPDNAVDTNEFVDVSVVFNGLTRWSDADIHLENANLEIGPAATFEVEHGSSGARITGSGSSFLNVLGAVDVKGHPSVPPRIEVPFRFETSSSLNLRIGSSYSQLDLRADGEILGQVDLAFGTELHVSSGTTLLDTATPLSGDGRFIVGTNGKVRALSDVDVRTTVVGEFEAPSTLSFTQPLRSEGGTFSGGGFITAVAGVELAPASGADATEVTDATTFTLGGYSQWKRGDLAILSGSRVVTAGLSELHVVPDAGNVTIREDGFTPGVELFDVGGRMFYAPGVGVAPAIEAELRTSPGSMVEVQSGVTLTLRAGGQLSGEVLVQETAKVRVLFQNLVVQTAGVLSGLGTFEPSLGGRIDLGGTLAPGTSDQTGTLTVNGPVDWSPNASLHIDLESPGLGDGVQLTGAQTIGGILGVRLNRTASFPGNTVHTVLSAGSLSGTFGATTVDPSSGYSLIPSYGAQLVTVAVESTPGSIGGTLFEDVDGNGLQDFGDPLLVGWTVEVYESGAFVDSDVTDDLGGYSFADLEAPGLYVVSVVIPPGYAYTTVPQNGYQNDGVAVEVQPGEPSTIDFGLTQSVGRVRGTVVHDIDEDGLLDVFDPALRGVDVLAIGSGGEGTFTVTTNEDGNYSFSLPIGTYTISPVPFAGWTPIFPNPLPVVEVTEGGSVDNVYLGVDSPRRSVRGIVYLDENANGEFDRLDDTLLAPDMVRIDGAGTTLTFENLGVGDQYGASIGSGPVTVIHPNSPYRVLTPPGGRLEIRTEEESGKDIVQDFGLVPGSVLSGVYFLDFDDDGLFTADVDLAVPGMELEISGVDFFRRVTTDATGQFSLAVDPGSYLIVISHGFFQFVYEAEVLENQSAYVLCANGLAPAYTVSSLSDSGPGSLRDGIERINDGSVSRIETGIAGTIDLDSPLPPVTKTFVATSGNAPKLPAPTLIVRGDDCGSCDGLVLQTSGSLVQGIQFEGFSGRGIVIDGNDNLVIGSAFVGNGSHGVEVASGSGNRVGLPGADRGNDIRDNTGAGVHVTTTERTELRANSIVDNQQGAIDHAGPTPPIPELLYFGGGGALVTGSLQGEPFGYYDVEIFGNDDCAPQAEAGTLRATLVVETDAAGWASFSADVGGATDRWSATATRFGGSTSEVSVCLDPNATAVEPPATSTTLAHFAYPNPARGGVTHIALSLPAPAHTRVRVYDLRGRLVNSLQEGTLPAGRHVLHWGGSDARGARVAAGIYFYELLVGGERFTQKIARFR